MSTVKQTLKFCMLRYPTIFPNPVDVLIHLFCSIGTGYEWFNGELVDFHTSEEEMNISTMKYPEKRSVDPALAELETSIGLTLKDQAKHIQMKFVEDNIDTIVNANKTNTYFGRERGGYGITKDIHIKYANAFSFPDTIKEDWAKTLCDFLQYWLYQLNVEYGAGDSKNDSLSWWPADIREARLVIAKTRARLYPYAHNGRTYEEHTAYIKELFKDLNIK